MLNRIIKKIRTYTWNYKLNCKPIVIKSRFAWGVGWRLINLIWGREGVAIKIIYNKVSSLHFSDRFAAISIIDKSIKNISSFGGERQKKSV